MSSHVWYAAYGSNLSPQRFDCYISGGRPEGARRTYTGCRDTAMPTGCREAELPGRVLFGGESSVWGGGIAFYDPSADGPSRATAYRLTAQQFSDVWSQERHLPVGDDVPLDAVVSDGRWTADDGRGDRLYDRVLLAGEIDGEPVVTFTFPTALRPVEQPPSAAYAATIERGLIATHGLSREEAAAYIASLISGRGSAHEDQ
ncbi:histone deacetylase [Flexivirga sp. B27]